MIRSLNLDPQFTPTSHSGIEFEMFQFSGGEMHIKLNTHIIYTDISKVIITVRIKNGDDIMKVLIAKDALKLMGVNHIELVMPYIPYARQDRVCVNGESFTLKVFCDLINSANFDKVYVLDAHNDVSPALINNCINIPNDSYVLSAANAINKEIILVSPDSGANKKINKLYDNLKDFTLFRDIVKCDKNRNLNTGELKGFDVFTNDLMDFDCLIVDDLIDGGRTFVGVAEALKAKNACDIYLFVSHGIFSYGFDELKKNIKHIYTTNSFKDIDDPFVTQIKIKI